MNISQEFETFTKRFYSHVLDDIEGKEELISFTISPFKDAVSRARLGAYLDKITSDKVSGEDLRKLWWSSPADTVFNDGEELRKFLRTVRDRL